LQNSSSSLIGAGLSRLVYGVLRHFQHISWRSAWWSISNDMFLLTM